jgi:hypothetical protein
VEGDHPHAQGSFTLRCEISLQGEFFDCSRGDPCDRPDNLDSQAFPNNPLTAGEYKIRPYEWSKKSHEQKLDLTCFYQRFLTFLRIIN